MHDVGQSDPVPLKRKLYIGYFIRAKHRSRTSSGGGGGNAADILNKMGRMHRAHRRLSMKRPGEMTYPVLSEFYHASRISREFRVFRLNSVFRRIENMVT